MDADTAKKVLKAEYKFSPSVTDAQLHDALKFEVYIISTYDTSPPYFSLKTSCCAYCSKLLGSPGSATCYCCKTCKTFFCSIACEEAASTSLHTIDNCQFANTLKTDTLMAEEKGNFISTFAYCLPPNPSSLPADYYNAAHFRMASLFVPKLGWLHGTDLFELIDILYK